MKPLYKGTLEEMKGSDMMALTIKSEFSALAQDLLMFYSDVQAANSASEELQSELNRTKGTN